MLTGLTIWTLPQCHSCYLADNQALQLFSHYFSPQGNNYANITNFLKKLFFDILHFFLDI